MNAANFLHMMPSEGRIAANSRAHAIDLIDPAMDMMLLCQTVLLSSGPIDQQTAAAVGSTIEQALKLLSRAREIVND